MKRTLPGYKTLLFYCILLALPLIIVEAALQLFYFATVGATLSARMEIPIYRSRSHGCYGLAKNLHYQHQTPEYRISIITNEHGLRTQGDGSFPVHGQDSAWRVMLLGPSFAFGWGTDYEDSFAGRLDDDLSVEIINAGVPAQPQSMQLCWLAHEGYKFDPDVVLYTHYGSVQDIESECRPEKACPVVIDRRLYTQSPTLRQRVIGFAKGFALVFYGWHFVEYFVRDESELPRGLGLELHDLEKRDPDGQMLDTLLRKYERYVEETRLAVKKDVPVIILHIPFSYVVHPEDRSRWSHVSHELDPGSILAERELADLVAHRLIERGVIFVNTTAALIERATMERMYYWLDIHLTAAGNRVVADAVAPALTAAIEAYKLRRSREQAGSEELKPPDHRVYD